MISRFLGFRGFRCFHRDNAIVVASLVGLAWWRRVRAPLRDQVGEDIQEFSCVRLAMENGNLLQESQEEDGVEGMPFPLPF